MTERLARTLEAVALRLQDAQVPFLLGGSGLLHALGVSVEVHDIDLVLRPEDRGPLKEAAGGWWRGITSATTPLWRSDWKATLDVDGVEVEALGGLAWAAADGRVARMPFRAEGSWRAGAAEIPLAPAAHWLLLYERYRPEKAARLAPLVPDDARNRARAELRLL